MLKVVHFRILELPVKRVRSLPKDWMPLSSDENFWKLSSKRNGSDLLWIVLLNRNQEETEKKRTKEKKETV